MLIPPHSHPLAQLSYPSRRCPRWGWVHPPPTPPCTPPQTPACITITTAPSAQQTFHSPPPTARHSHVPLVSALSAASLRCSLLGTSPLVSTLFHQMWKVRWRILTYLWTLYQRICCINHSLKSRNVPRGTRQSLVSWWTPTGRWNGRGRNSK